MESLTGPYSDPFPHSDPRHTISYLCPRCVSTGLATVPHSVEGHVPSRNCRECVRAGIFPPPPPRVPVSRPVGTAGPTPDPEPAFEPDPPEPDPDQRDRDVDPRPDTPESRTRNTRAVPALLPLVEGVASAAADVASYAGAAYVTYEGLSELYTTLRKAYNSFVTAAVPLGYSPRITVQYAMCFSWVEVGAMLDVLASILSSNLTSPSIVESNRCRLYLLLQRSPPFTDSRRFPENATYHMPLAPPFLSHTTVICDFLSFRWRDSEKESVDAFFSAIQSYIDLLDPLSTQELLQTYVQETFESRYRLRWS